MINISDIHRGEDICDFPFLRSGKDQSILASHFVSGERYIDVTSLTAEESRAIARFMNLATAVEADREKS